MDTRRVVISEVEMSNTLVKPNSESNMQLFDKFKKLNTSVLPRSFVIALVIGSALNLINQFEAFFGTDDIQVLPLLLMFVTPFAVVFFSLHASFYRAWQDINHGRAPNKIKGLLLTSFAHGIPVKALIFGVIVGTINLVILLLEDYLSVGDLGMVSLIQIAQFYTLPIFFGFFSQVLSYRKAIAVFEK